MQASGLRRKANVPIFANHTPREWEIIAALQPSHPSGYSDMFGGPTGMSIGAGPLYTNSLKMGHAPSALEREKLTKARSTILREDSVRQTEEPSDFYSPGRPPLSRDDSWSMHYADTNQAPFSDPARSRDGDSMNTQSSLLRLPKENESYELVRFLRTSGPVAPTRQPSKLEHQPRRAVSAPKSALRFLRLGGGSSRRQVQNAHERPNGVLRDEGGLLMEMPVEQKTSSTGKPYLALQVPEQIAEEQDARRDDPLVISPEVVDSHVSMYFHDEANTSAAFESWVSFLRNEQAQTQQSRLEDATPAKSYEEVASRLQRKCPAPVRPAASVPPSPVLSSTVSETDSYVGDSLLDHPAVKLSLDMDRAFTERALSGHTVPGASHPTAEITLPHEECPVRHPRPGKEVEIKQPLPRRLGSHPVLSQRASSISSAFYSTRSLDDSPGPPPPRSPLRLRRDPRTIESIVANHDHERKTPPRTAPSIKTLPSVKSTTDCDFAMEPIRATITTECSGPIRRAKSRGKDSSSVSFQDAPGRRERNERVRARKLRDRPSVDRTIDSIVHAPTQATRQRLKKIRPQITIPDLRPSPLRAPSAASHASFASSTPSWKKVTQSTVSPVSPVPSQASERSSEDRTGYTPISPTASAAASALQTGHDASPTMLVAEEVPVCKARSPPKPARLVLKERKPYAPRPRSASIAATAAKRRSKTSVVSVTGSVQSKSPGVSPLEDDAPPLPSPPPDRALPPTPPASGSERPSKATSKARVIDTRKDLPALPPSHDVSPTGSPTSSKKERFAHVATQRKGVSSSAGRSDRTAASPSRIDARLAALEKQNALLSAALMAVLKTNGALNAPVPGSAASEEGKLVPMGWESRVARRSAATSHTAESSNDESALEMYMSTRRGSRQY